MPDRLAHSTAEQPIMTVWNNYRNVEIAFKNPISSVLRKSRKKSQLVLQWLLRSEKLPIMISQHGFY